MGAIVGGTIGGVLGGIAGGLGADERPRFHSYVVEQRRPSYRYQGDVSEGTELPEEGVTYYEVPGEYGAREYRYTIINDRPALVDPRSHRIVEVVEYAQGFQVLGAKAAPRAAFMKFPDAADALEPF